MGITAHTFKSSPHGVKTKCDRSSYVKDLKKELGEKFIPCVLPHLCMPGQSCEVGLIGQFFVKLQKLLVEPPKFSNA